MDLTTGGLLPDSVLWQCIFSSFKKGDWDDAYQELCLRLFLRATELKEMDAALRYTIIKRRCMDIRREWFGRLGRKVLPVVRYNLSRMQVYDVGLPEVPVIRWPNDTVRDIFLMRGRGMTQRQIAMAMGRSLSSVEQMAAAYLPRLREQQPDYQLHGGTA